MKLNLHIICDDLHDLDVKGRLSSDKWEQTLAFAAYTDGVGKLKSDRLYITEAENLRFMLSHASGHLSVLCVGKPEPGALEMADGRDIAWTDRQTSANGLVERVNELFGTYQDWIDSIDQAFAENAPFKVIGRLCEPIFHDPIWMWDAHLQTVFHVVNRNHYTLPRDYKLHEDGTPWPADEVNAVNETFLKSRERREPFELPAMFGYHTLCYNLYDGDVYAATIGVDEIDGRRLGTRDAVLLKTIGDKMSFGLSYQPHFSKHATILMNTQIDQLLNHANVPTSSLSAALGQKGWSIDDSYLCIVADQHRIASYSDLILLPIAEHICDELSEAVYALHDGDLVFVVNRSLCELKTTELLARIDAVLEEEHLDMPLGISTRFSNFALLPYFKEQADQAAERGAAADPEEKAHFFGDYQFELMTDKLVKGTVPEALYPPTLLRLMRYDRENDGDLVEVLGAYLRNDLSSNKTAAELYIHRNTLLNRIKRIESVGKIDFSDEHAVLLLELSYALMNRLGKR